MLDPKYVADCDYLHVYGAKNVQIRTLFWSVFSPNTGSYGPEKNSVFGHFLCSGLLENSMKIAQFVETFFQTYCIEKLFWEIS